MKLIDFELDILPEDVGDSDEYSGYHITELGIDEARKHIIHAYYDYSWHCGDGCCSDTQSGYCYVRHLSKWVQRHIVEKFPGYKLMYPTYD